MKLNLENLESKFENVMASPEYKEFIKQIKESKNIYLAGNGGLWSTANHAADDCNRLLTKAGINKMFNSMDSQCLITSVANDYGFNNIFVRWLELFKKNNTKASETMVIGLSCSGTSKNVISATVKVSGAGYFLPTYAGNLDIINAAAIETARLYILAKKEFSQLEKK
jgi:phosphoheptose isomerase